ncbi:hypothetical protein TCELL_0759 [Thermogladius calderae 1633]|uniref:Uncharacterized protein n=1 Tax=Thermogladius calderae (strain DSM 22663 / VKM B-2946 / 1633) TaxID=1184251 RepID=I3TEJ5_THEC1|nr:hypothetical protein [Thermogladius calderae]AFK51183.1 hypothetical protein TCELL_0759 [Thermogladius calderae 1633]
MDKPGLSIKFELLLVYVAVAVVLVVIQQLVQPSVLYGVFPDNTGVNIAPVGRVAVVITDFNDARGISASTYLSGFVPALQITPANRGDVLVVRGYGPDWIQIILLVVGLGVLSLAISRTKPNVTWDKVHALLVLILVVAALSTYTYYTVAVEKNPVMAGWYARVTDRPFDKINITGVGYELGVLDFFNGSYLLNVRTNASVIAIYTPGVGLVYWQGCLGTEGVQYMSKYFTTENQTYVLIQPWNSTVYYSRIEFARYRSGMEGLVYLTISVAFLALSVLVQVLYPILRRRLVSE